MSEVNEYDHEDAIKDANGYAGRNIDIPKALKFAASKDQAMVIIVGLQDDYLKMFNAFIAGVDWGRENPAAPESSDS